MKVLNLYAGIGGNRKRWEDVEVTAVEIDPDIAKIYQDYFPDDTVIVGDAHQYLLDHYKEFDFIWSSPPCPTHSKIAVNFANHNIPPKYPDMRLYQEIIFLDTFYKGKYCVENVVPFYTPLIQAQKHDRHLFWANFRIPQTNGNPKKQTLLRNQNDRDAKKYFKPSDVARWKGIEMPDLGSITGKVLNNCCLPQTGLLILNCARNIITKQDEKQIDIFI